MALAFAFCFLLGLACGFAGGSPADAELPCAQALFRAAAAEDTEYTQAEARHSHRIRNAPYICRHHNLRFSLYYLP